MKVPTPNLIKELRQPIHSMWLYPYNNEPDRLRKLMDEAADQLEWFLKNEKEKIKND